MTAVTDAGHTHLLNLWVTDSPELSVFAGVTASQIRNKLDYLRYVSSVHDIRRSIRVYRAQRSVPEGLMPFWFLCFGRDKVIATSTVHVRASHSPLYSLHLRDIPPLNPSLS